MKKETIRIGLKRSKNFQTYESTVEREIFYETEEQRKEIKNKVYAELRKDIKEQMEIDSGKGVKK